MSPTTYATVDVVAVAVAVAVAAVVTRAVERGVRTVSYPRPRGNGGAP